MGLRSLRWFDSGRNTTASLEYGDGYFVNFSPNIGSPLFDQVPLDVIRQRMGEDAVRMYEWFDRVGYAVDRAPLRREFPDATFHDFESWAKTQDWKALLQSA